MDFIQSSRKVCAELAKQTGTEAEDWFLCLRARFGMKIIFETIYDKIGKGDVITTPFTCITAVTPIILGRLHPVYADLDIENLSFSNPDKKLLSNKTRAIMMQNTLGIIGDKTQLAKVAKTYGALLIEDSAQCVARMAKDKDGKILADISVHSFGAEKTFSGTKFGGAIWINPELKRKNPDFYNELTDRLIALPQPDSKLAFRIKNYRNINGVLQRLPHSIKRPVRNFTLKTKLLEPPVLPIEQDCQQTEAYNTNDWVNQKILENLPSLSANLSRRLSNTQYYNENLHSAHFQKHTTLNEPLLAYPIIFDTPTKATAAYDLLTNAGFFVRRWYMPLLFPGPTSNRKYDYNPKMAPIAESVSPRVLSIPTDLTLDQTKKICELLNTHAKPVEN